MSQSNSEESREQRILRIKREIAAGTYDTPERLMAAMRHAALTIAKQGREVNLDRSPLHGSPVYRLITG